MKLQFETIKKALITLLIGLCGLLFVDVAYAQQTGTTLDAIQMLINLSNTYPSLTRLVYAASYLMGLAMMIKAIYAFKVYGETRTMMSQQTTIKTPIILVVVASVLLWLPSGLHTLIETAFGHEYVLQYTVSPSNPLGQAGTNALIYLIQLVGLISFIRGWVYLAQGAGGGQSQHTTGKALTHIIGGLFAVNVVEFTNILWSTFGFTPPFNT